MYIHIHIYIYIYTHIYIYIGRLRNLQLMFVKLQAGIADAISARLRVELPAGDAEQPPPKEKAPP